MEVKQQDEEDEGEAGGCSKGGKLSNIKMEEKPVKLEFKKEEFMEEGGKSMPMDTSATSTFIKMEDRKPEVKKEVKKEVKEEEESSDSVTPQTPVKKKSKNSLYFLLFGNKRSSI